MRVDGDRKKWVPGRGWDGGPEGRWMPEGVAILSRPCARPRARTKKTARLSVSRPHPGVGFLSRANHCRASPGGKQFPHRYTLPPPTASPQTRSEHSCISKVRSPGSTRSAFLLLSVKLRFTVEDTARKSSGLSSVIGYWETNGYPVRSRLMGTSFSHFFFFHLRTSSLVYFCSITPGIKRISKINEYR